MGAGFTKGENIPLLILSTLAVAGNASIIVVVVGKKAMRTYTNGFVCSLALSDILIGGILLPSNAAGIDQAIQSYMVSICLLSGVANVATVSLDRYLAVLKPLHYQALMQEHYITILVSSWSLALGISLLPLTWSASASLTVYKIYVLCVQILFVVLPYVLVFIGYYRISKQVRRAVRKEKKFSVALDLNNPNQHTKKHPISYSSERKIARLSIVITSTFLLTWLPVEYLTLMSYTGQWLLIPKQLPIISRYTIALGTLVDPIVYSFMKPDFRKAFKDILGRVLSRRTTNAEAVRFVNDSQKQCIETNHFSGAKSVR